VKTASKGLSLLLKYAFMVGCVKAAWPFSMAQSTTVENGKSVDPPVFKAFLKIKAS